MTAGELLALFADVDPETPVTVQHEGWWLNISGVHVPPVVGGVPEEPSVQIETTNDFDTRQW